MRAENGRHNRLLGWLSERIGHTASRYLHRLKRDRPPRLRVANRWLRRLLGFRLEQAGNTAQGQLRSRKHRSTPQLRGALRPNPHLLGGSGIVGTTPRMREQSDYWIHWLVVPQTAVCGIGAARGSHALRDRISLRRGPARQDGNATYNCQGPVPVLLCGSCGA